MPSFEHSNQSSPQHNADSLYQPGKNRENDSNNAEDEVSEELLPTTQLVTRKGDVAAAAEMAAAEEAAKEAAREEIANRSPRYIDAEYGDPAPTIQQSIRIKPQPAGPRKPGLRRGGRPATSKEVVKGGGSFGEVESPTLSQETLSGNRVKDGKVEEPQRRERKPREPREEKPAAEEASSEGEAQAKAPREPREPREPRKDGESSGNSRKRGGRNRNRNRDRQPRQEGDAKKGDRPQRPRQEAPKPKAEPKAPEPTGLFGKIKKALGGIFGAEEPAKPQAKQESQKGDKPRQGNRPPRKDNRQQGGNRKGQGGNRQNRGDQDQEQGDGPNKPRRRRGGRRRGGRNRSNQNRDGQQAQQNGGDAS